MERKKGSGFFVRHRISGGIVGRKREKGEGAF